MNAGSTLEFHEWIDSMPKHKARQVVLLVVRTAASDVINNDADPTKALFDARRYVMTERRHEIEESISGEF